MAPDGKERKAARRTSALSGRGPARRV